MRRSTPGRAAAADLPGVEIRLSAGGTLKVRYSAGVRIGEPEARQILSRVQELAAGTPRPVLVELAGLGSVTSSAMTLFANRLPASCMALVGMSPVDVAVAKFFNTVHRPPYPVEYFSSYPHALAWLGRGPQNAGHGDPGRPGLPHASAPHPGHPARATAAAPGPERDTSLSCQTAGPEQPARQARLRQKLARVFAPGAVPDAAGRPHAGTGAAGPGPEQPARPVAADTLRQVTEAYHGKTRSKSFPKATAVAGALDDHHAGVFTALLAQCPPAERDLIATHLYRHFLHSPRQLARWVKTAGHSYFHARARVAGTGIGRIRPRPGTISTARQADRNSTGFNVAPEARDAIALINGLVRSHRPGHIGLQAQHNIISLAASLARLLITEGDEHPLAGSYREYTDLYGVRHSIVENGTGLIDLILKHPDATALLCKYIDSGRYRETDQLRRAVLGTAPSADSARTAPRSRNEGTPARTDLPPARTAL